jgi:hypothetical protein
MVPAGALFLVLYGITAVGFSGVMVRLMLVLGTARLTLLRCCFLKMLRCSAYFSV